MSKNQNVLKPLSDFDIKDAGRRLYDLTKNESVQIILAKRHLVEAIFRYSADVDGAVNSVKRAAQADRAGKAATLAIVNGKGDIAGLATAIPRQAPTKLRDIIRKIPPAFVSWPLSFRLRNYNTYVSAWTNEALVPRSSPQLLRTAYSELIDPRGGPAWEIFAGGDYAKLDSHQRGGITRQFNPWTLETGFRNSPAQLALQRAGLLEQETGWFDNGEARQQPVPHSTLYALRNPMEVAS